MELRTPAIFSSKKRCSSCASMDVDGSTRPRPMRASIDFYRSRGVERSDSTFAFQNDSRFWHRTSRYARRSMVQEAAAVAALATLTAIGSAAVGRLARLDTRSSRRTDRLAFRHSSSNQDQKDGVDRSQSVEVPIGRG